MSITWSSASAENPNRFEANDRITLFPDVENGLSVWVNTTARDFCNWQSGPPTGPPPAIDTVVLLGKETGKGAVVGRFSTDVYIEVRRFDEDPSPLIGPCEDIAEQLADPDAEPFATGTANWKGNDNDVFGSETRGNSFGDGIKAVVTDSAGNDYRYTSTFHVNNRCHAPEFAPPACLRDAGTLTPI